MKTKFIMLYFYAFVLAGCVQMPTLESKTVDNRPQLTFSITGESNVSNYSVSIDNLDNGSIAPYTDTNEALRVLSGTHLIEIYKNNELISSRKIYLGDGVTKEIIIK
ncbi:hypothetical protein [Psychromonas sp. Urea-02u-13]|uniref:hypothetical protein n=1 Tax=Psychromonas sp. Urea-02u-13 TaxID=2058326 RepID=UPI000C33AEC4|nr:hypothetical protein [Psychromonas sp. Urea-02u-13]PKG40378.1 hypothetical protein CXF74_03455 [Psychromonas sp. Urea-02u-13]